MGRGRRGRRRGRARGRRAHAQGSLQGTCCSPCHVQFARTGRDADKQQGGKQRTQTVSSGVAMSMSSTRPSSAAVVSALHSVSLVHTMTLPALSVRLVCGARAGGWVVCVCRHGGNGCREPPAAEPCIPPHSAAASAWPASASLPPTHSPSQSSTKPPPAPAWRGAWDGRGACRPLQHAAPKKHLCRTGHRPAAGRCCASPPHPIPRGLASEARRGCAAQALTLVAAPSLSFSSSTLKMRSSVYRQASLDTFLAPLSSPMPAQRARRQCKEPGRGSGNKATGSGRRTAAPLQPARRGQPAQQAAAHPRS